MFERTMVGWSLAVMANTFSRYADPADNKTRCARIIWLERNHYQSWKNICSLSPPTCLSCVARVTSTKSSSSLSLSNTSEIFVGWLFHFKQYCLWSSIFTLSEIISRLLQQLACSRSTGRTKLDRSHPALARSGLISGPRGGGGAAGSIRRANFENLCIVNTT